MSPRRILPIVVIPILAACAAQAAQTVDVDSASYRGSLVSLRTGDTLRVRLQSNPSTGYSWTRAAAAPDELTLIDSTFSPAAGTAVGAPGQQHFHFLATQPGRSTLLLVYARPWEAGAPPADSIRVDFNVGAR